MMATGLPFGKFLDGNKFLHALISIAALADIDFHLLEVQAFLRLMGLVAFYNQGITIGCHQLTEGELFNGTRDGSTLFKFLGNGQGSGEQVEVVAGAGRLITHSDIPLFLQSSVGGIVGRSVDNAEVLVKFRDGGMVGEGAFIPVFHILVRMFFAL